MLDWYVAKIKPRMENSVELALASYGVVSYVPEIVVLKGGRTRLEPLFPGYAFVQVDTETELWRRVRWAQGVSYFLPGNLEPAPIGAEFLEDLMGRVRGWNGDGWTNAFKKGDPIRIETGPLQGLDAIFHRYVPGKQRCDVLISMVGKDHRVSVDERSLTALALGRGSFTYAPAV